MAPRHGDISQLFWRRAQRLQLGNASTRQWSALQRWLLAGWQVLQPLQIEAERRRLLMVDGQWAGCCAWQLPEHESWLCGAGVVIDPGLSRALSPSTYGQLMTLMGPLALSLAARRLGHRGYRTRLPLMGLGRWSPAMDAKAYVQQVQSGAVDGQGLLAAHLRFGAQVTSVSSEGNPSWVDLQWRR